MFVMNVHLPEKSILEESSNGNLREFFICSYWRVTFLLLSDDLEV